MESEITDCAKPAGQLNDHIRRAGINPNRWYMIAKASDVLDKPLGREIWRQTVVLVRTSDGELRALEDRCAHRRA